jgi:hypothetical protein
MGFIRELLSGELLGFTGVVTTADVVGSAYFVSGGGYFLIIGREGITAFFTSICCTSAGYSTFAICRGSIAGLCLVSFYFISEVGYLLIAARG